MENKTFREDMMVKIAVEASSVETVEDANVFISHWVIQCESREDYKFLKLCLDMIVRSYLSKKYSYEVTGELSEKEESKLRELFNSDRKKFSALYYLIDSENSLNVLSNYVSAIDYTEKQMQQEIVENFDKLFPKYTFIKKEYCVPSGRIDILAKDDEGKDVLIELKLHNKNPNRQLLDYKNYFDNAVLIGITQDKLGEKIKRDNIIYYTYDKDKKEIQRY